MMLHQLLSHCSSKMHHTTNLLFTTLIVILIASSSQVLHAHGGGCIPAERAALLAFHKGITSDGAHVLTSWHGPDCCRWKGVSCNNRTGHVIKLHLCPNKSPKYYCIGDLCRNANSLFGEISPSLLSLKHLEHLDLSMNYLLGPNGHIPQFLGSMENLRYLNLSGMPFIGRVPSQLGNLSKLRHLDLGNGFSYPGMYSTDINWLTKLQLLRYLSMRSINLSRIAEWPHTLNMIPSLRVINLAECSLATASQSLPYLNLTKLEKLDLSYNYLDNSIASSWFWKATTLKYLSLGWNQLFGKFTDAPGNMTSLKVLDLSSNHLNRIGYLKIVLQNLCCLEILDLSGNYMNGDIVEVMEGLPRCTWGRLLELHFHQNEFMGTLPNFVGQFISLSILDLSSNNLFGLIPPRLMNLPCLTKLDLSMNQLNGNVPTEIGALTALTSLDISNNNLAGSLPAGLGKLKHLDTLSLGDNKITGPIPPEVMRSTSLTFIYLSSNQLNGSVPTEIGALTALTSLHISSNNLAGSLPAGLGKLKHLDKLCLQENKITGPIPPEVMHLTSLTILDLSSNHFNGSVPTEFGSLGNLVEVDLSKNNLSSVITGEHFANLKSLTKIDLSSNNLKIVVDSDWRSPFKLQSANFSSCQIGLLFPAWLQQMRGIDSLDISSTDLEDKFPDWFWYTFSLTKYLDISNNQISGILPSHLDSMAYGELHLSSNRLTGSIPSLLANITLLDISNNSFSGVIPSNFEASQLRVLLIYSNGIGGYIPESICKLQELLYLDLSNNFLEGEIPQCFDIQKLHFLLLSNNSLSGNFPAFLQNNTDIEFLDLAWNKLSGRLPTWLGDLVLLSFVLLSHNAFSDNIPVSITSLIYLQYLDLSSNNLSGVIPWHLSNLSIMTEVQSEYTFENDVGDSDGALYLGQILSVVTKGQQLLYGRTLIYFVGIDLSGNSLTGEIPTDISSLAALMNLNLSSNKLSGQIPNMIGAMQSLVSLDLSHNKLSGEIPSSLSSLASLAALNLSYNNLSGRIPSGRQLDTLNTDNPSRMYIGNGGLCGPPLHNSCPGNGSFVIHGALGRNKQEFDPLTFHFGLVLGLVVGLWIVFCALLFKRAWRIAYFRLFDEAYDQIYVFMVVKWGSFAKNTAAE